MKAYNNAANVYKATEGIIKIWEMLSEKVALNN